MIVLLLSGSYYFLYYTNERFKEATARFTAIQEQNSGPVVGSSGTEMMPGLKGKTVSMESSDGAKSSAAPTTPVPAQATKPMPKTSQTAPVNAIPDKDIAGSAPVDQAKVQPVLLTENMDEAGSKALAQSVALPKEPLVIRFKYDSNLFSVADIEKMKEFARLMKQHPEATINVFGYTDSSGDQDYNKKLSEFRANMVKSFLMGQNLTPDKLNTQGFGNSNPVGSNDTEEGRTMNRRVEIRAVVKE